jgi:hypothetical protein
MAEELPDGSYQGYSTYCPVCHKTVKCNMQGDIDDVHECVPYQPPAQIGCIIPIYGHAINSSLKDFVKWFNENYEVKKV